MSAAMGHQSGCNAKRILITNYSSPANRGDAAIMEGLLHSLRASFPEASFVVHSSAPELVPLMHGVEARRDLCDWLPPRGSTLRRALLTAWATGRRKGIGPSLPRAALAQTLQDYEDADLVVCTGGGNLHDYYDGCVGRLWSLRIAKSLGKTVCLCAQSFGPFERPDVRRIAASTLRKADLIIARDEASMEVLQSLGLSSPQVQLTADVAFAMPRKPDDYESLPRWEKPPALNDNEEAERIITLSVRTWPRLSSTQQENYLQSFASLVDWAAESLGTPSLFLSTCTSPQAGTKDDRHLGAHIAQLCETAPPVMWGEYDPYEIVNLISARSAVHVGTRMHSNVLALLAGVPIIGIEYEPKIRGVAREFGLEEFIIDITQITPDLLIEKVQQAITNRTELTHRIAEAMPGARESAMRNGELVRAVCERRSSESGAPAGKAES